MSEDSGRERPTKKVPIEVYQDKQVGFQLALLKLRVFYEKKQDVPFDVIQDFFSCMNVPPRRNIPELVKQIEEYTEETFQYFKKSIRFKYDFEVTLLYKDTRVFNREHFRENSMRAIKKNKITTDEFEYTYTLKSLLHFLYDELLSYYPNL